MKVVLAALAVLVIAALVVYFLDQALGWGVVANMSSVLVR
jgi:preprotein translocase subunit SecE